MRSRWVALTVVFTTRLSMGVQFQAVAAVAPPLVADLQLSYAQLGTLIGLYMLPGVALALPGGILGQRLGERRAVIASLGLMALGGGVTAWSDGFLVAAAGRLASGVGAVLMNLLLAKMVAGWFAGREMSTAMAVMLTAWPVGLGLATATLGVVAAAASWRAAIVVTSLAAVLGMVLMATVYRDPPRPVAAESPERRARPGRRDLGLAITAGAAWGLFNASLITVVAFAPALLVARGTSLADAGAMVSLALWVTIASIPLGGVLGDRLGRPDLVIVAGSLVSAVAILLLPAMARPFLGFILVGLLVGGPPGAMMALLPRAVPSEVLAVVLGVFYTVFYVVTALTQPAAGLVADVWGDPAAPIVFAAVLMLATVGGLVAFRLVESARRDRG